MTLDSIIDAIGVTPYNRTESGVLYCADCLDVLPKIPEKSVGLVVADPPYYRINGEFDFKWNTFDDYLADVKLWGEAVKAILSESGTLFWFGDDKNISYTQIVLDKYFGLLNNLVWWKYNLRGGAFGTSGGDSVRSFPICTERILMYANDVYNLTQCVYAIRDYIRGEILRARGKIVFKEINAALGTATNGGGVASACLSLDKSEPAMFTDEMYGRLRGWLGADYLRREYEDLRRPFNNNMNLTEVLQFNSAIATTYGHPTIKPLQLIKSLCSTCSRPCDIILDPFCGSGTTLVAAKQLGRKYIGIEISEAYCKICVERLKQEELF